MVKWTRQSTNRGPPNFASGGLPFKDKFGKKVFDIFPYVTYLLSVCTVCLDSTRPIWEEGVGRYKKCEFSCYRRYLMRDGRSVVIVIVTLCRLPMSQVQTVVETKPQLVHMSHNTLSDVNSLWQPLINHCQKPILMSPEVFGPTSEISQLN